MSCFNVLPSFCFAGTTKYNPFSTSTLREHGDHELCSDPLDSVNYLHRLEKRSYLPPVTCTKNHEMSVVRSKVHCQPRPRLVRLPWPNDTSVHKVNNCWVWINRKNVDCWAFFSNWNFQILDTNIKKILELKISQLHIWAFLHFQRL